MNAAKRGGRADRRLRRQQPPLHLRRQRQIAPQLLLLQRALVQPRVLDHQREDLGRAAQQLRSRAAVNPHACLSAEAPERAARRHELVLGAQRHRHPGAALRESLDLGDMLAAGTLAPTPPGLEVAGGQRQRMRVVSQPVDQHAVRRNRAVRASILVAGILLEQQDESRADPFAQRGERQLQRFRKRGRAVNRAGDLADQRLRRSSVVARLPPALASPAGP